VTCKTLDAFLKCKLTAGEDPAADAWGNYDSGEETGWGKLHVLTSVHTSHSAYAAGYLEGALTHARMSNHLRNFKQKFVQNLKIAAAVSNFTTKNRVYMNKGVASGNAFWSEAALILSQMDGILAGYNDHSAAAAAPQDISLLNMQGDIDDVISAVMPSERTDWEGMTSVVEAYNSLLPKSHCSAIIKVAPDFSELYQAHNMWWPYYSMNRIAKEYKLGNNSQVSLTSYPGTLSSTDDFYQVGGVVVV
jgi:hypothetical protein